MTTQAESGVFYTNYNYPNPAVKIADYTYDEIVTPSEIYNNYEEANQYIIDWHVWWNLGAPKLCPEIKSPLTGTPGDELTNVQTYFNKELAPWGRNTPTILDLEILLARRKPKEDLIKLGLRRKGVSPLMAETVMLFLRCLDHQNRSASFIEKLDHWGLGFSVWKNTIDYKVSWSCDCVSDFRLFDPLDEIESAYIEIGGQIIKKFEKVQDKFWKLNLFCDPFPPLPILKIGFQEIKISIHRNSEILNILRNSDNTRTNDSKAISLEYINTIVNKSRRLMYFNHRIDGYGEDIRWRASAGMIALLIE